MKIGVRGFLTSSLYSLVSLFFFFNTAHAGTDDLSPQELVTRCFQSIANIRLPMNDPRRATVTNQQSALALCDRLIDAPRLSSTGLIQSSISSISSNEAREVIRRFQQFHETIFKTDKFSDVFEDSGKPEQLHDSGNSAAYFTYSFFNNTPDYALAVTEPSPLYLVRANLPTSRYGTIRELASTSKTVFEAYNDSEYYANPGTPLLLRGVDRGMLLGIKKTSPSDPLHYYNGSGPGFQSDSSSAWDPIWRDSLGGGFMGESTFLLLNMGLAEHVTSNGSMVLPRRWAKEVMAAAFCRNGPYFGPDSSILSNDISTNISAPPFRQYGECMKCHSTMDPMAMAVRNIKFKYMGKESQPPELNGFARCTNPNGSSPYCTNGQTNANDIYPMLHRLKYSSVTATNNSLYWPVPSGGDPSFFSTKGKGRLSFKSAFDNGQNANTSEIINEIFDADISAPNQLANLGNKIKDKKDYYLCGAMRYYELLSGTRIEIKSDDLPNLTSSAGAYDVNLWNYLKNEALTFKNHRNPKTLMKSLIRSPQFISQSWGRKPASTSIRITAVTPHSGSTLGGTPITISGANFSNGTTVSFSGLPCTITGLTSTQITCNTSSSTYTGSVAVMTTKNGYTAVLPDGFTYISPPTFTGLKPIFENKCVGCHSGPVNSAPGGLSFGDYTGPNGSFVFVHSNLLVPGENFVVPPPGNPLSSKIYIRTDPLLTPTSNPSIMPQGALNPDDKLSTNERTSILMWIQNGAQND